MIEIMDTTLRDGEQTSGVSFAAHEKLSIAQVLLGDLGVNRIEIASARVSEGEFEAVRRVAAWASRTAHLDKLEVLGFVDGSVSLDWIESACCRVMNLLCKGSFKHVTEQLRKTPQQHLDDITEVVNEATWRIGRMASSTPQITSSSWWITSRSFPSSVSCFPTHWVS